MSSQSRNDPYPNRYGPYVYNPFWLDIGNVMEDNADQSLNGVLASPDILPIILKFLPKPYTFQKVCRKWRAVALDNRDRRLGIVMALWCREMLPKVRYTSIPLIILAHRFRAPLFYPEAYRLMTEALGSHTDSPGLNGKEGITNLDRIEFLKIILNYGSPEKFQADIEFIKFGFKFDDLKGLNESDMAILGSVLILDPDLASAHFDIPTPLSRQAANVISCLCVYRLSHGMSFQEAIAFLNNWPPVRLLDWLKDSWFSTPCYKKYREETSQLYNTLLQAVPPEESHLYPTLNPTMDTEAEGIRPADPKNYGYLAVSDWIEEQKAAFPGAEPLFEQLDQQHHKITMLNAQTSDYFLQKDHDNGLRRLQELQNLVEEAFATLEAIKRSISPIEPRFQTFLQRLESFLNLASGNTTYEQSVILHSQEDGFDLLGILHSIRFVYNV